MSRKSDDKIVPRNGHTLMVVSVCRISGCADHKELSLDDQEDNAEETVSDLYEGPIESSFTTFRRRAKANASIGRRLRRLRRHTSPGNTTSSFTMT